MKLVENWRNAWKWFSVQSLAVLVALPLVWPVLPADVKAWVPPEWQPWLFVTIAFGGLLGRLVDQSKKDAGP